MKLNYALKPLAVAMLTAGLAISMTSYAAVTEENAKRVKENYPLGTMAEWLQPAEATAYALNPVNIRAGKHPDREDPEGGDYDVVYIFPDADSAESWWPLVANPSAPMPTDIPADAVALIHWELDNGSGSFPGIMSKSDVDGFKSRNCIMAAGDTIPQPGVKDGIEKTCSNPQGASKRFKMNVLKADEPIDLVYNVETAPLTYNNFDTLPTFDGVEEAGRIYRVLQKWHNATGMDVPGDAREGTRIAGFKLELGIGVGSDFKRLDSGDAVITAAGIDPTKTDKSPDKALGFETRECMPDQFLDLDRDPQGTGTNPCVSPVVQTDSEGQELPQEIWLEEEYSTFSPKMYSFNGDKRAPVGGFWDKRPAGIYPPPEAPDDAYDGQTKHMLDSGTLDSLTYDRIDGSTPISGYIGATTPNYLNIVATQADPVTGINPPSPFGYLMYHGIISEGDYGILSQGAYVDPDGDPSSEGDLIAWWDGDEYRWGIDPDYNGEIEDNKYTVVPTETLVEWAMFPLEEEPDAEGNYPPGPLYEIGVMDDLAGLNVDSFIYLGRNFTGTQFTVRLTAQSVADAGIGAGAAGNETPAWVGAGNGPKPLEEYISTDAVLRIKATGYAGDPLEVTLADILVNVPEVTVTNLDTEEFELINLSNADTHDERIWFNSLPTAANPEKGGDDDGTLNVWPFADVQASYFDESEGDYVYYTIEIPAETIEPVVPGDDTNGGGGGGGCTIGTGTAWNITMPALLAALLGFGWMRRRRKEQQ